MIASLHAPLARGALLLLAAVAALTAGCGPTTGGTGTGSASFTLNEFGAASVSICTSGPADRLGCASLVVAPGTGAQGSATVVFTGTGASGPWTLTITGNTAEFVSRCGGARFDGDWGQVTGTEPRFYGSWVGVERGAPVKAQLSVVLPKDLPDGLQLLVLDVAGAPLFGPLQVRRVPAPPTDTPVCP